MYIIIVKKEGKYKSITGISQKMLLEQLHEMQEFGLVDKKTYEGYPLKVEYFLTERGKKGDETNEDSTINH